MYAFEPVCVYCGLVEAKQILSCLKGEHSTEFLANRPFPPWLLTMLQSRWELQRQERETYLTQELQQLSDFVADGVHAKIKQFTSQFSAELVSKFRHERSDQTVSHILFFKLGQTGLVRIDTKPAPLNSAAGTLDSCEVLNRCYIQSFTQFVTDSELGYSVLKCRIDANTHNDLCEV